MYYVYIIHSEKLEKNYIGSVSDLKARIKKHNSKESKFTSKGCPWEVVYYEVFKNKRDALREERFLKTGKGRERIKMLFEK